MLKDRTLGDTQFGGDVADTRGVIAVFGKVPHGGIHDKSALTFRAGAGRHATIVRGVNQAACNSAHG